MNVSKAPEATFFIIVLEEIVFDHFGPGKKELDVYDNKRRLLASGLIAVC